MNKAIIGKKLGMTQIFSADGKVIPVTVVEAGPCPIVQLKTVEKDGYAAVKLGFDEVREGVLNKPEIGQFKKAGVKPCKVLKEVRVDNAETFEVGAELKADVTRAVAKFTGKTVLTAANYNIIRVNGAALTDYDFGTLVSASDDKATYWLRDGHIVKFGTTYDHYIWDSANIMSSYDATTAIRPTVVIDKYPVDGAYMVEYDKGNKAIAEVGILFGSSAKITVDSCSSKATSQWNKAHGQFAATPLGDEDYARNYLIYADGDSYKVIYTDAVAIQ